LTPTVYHSQKPLPVSTVIASESPLLKSCVVVPKRLEMAAPLVIVPEARST
jgi:hypothetical protein